MSREIIYLIIIGVLGISLFYFIFLALINKKKINALTKDLSVLKSQQKYHFNDDMEFLLYLIEYKCTTYINLTLKPLSSIKDNKLLSNDDLNKAVEEIVVDVMDCFNEEYLNVIHKYFSEKGFRMYLIELIFNTLAVFISRDNAGKIKSFNKGTGFDTNIESNSKYSTLDKTFGKRVDIDE